MKRIILALAIVLAILASGFWCLWKFYRLQQETAPLLAAMEEAAEAADMDSGKAATEQFLEYWKEYEPSLLRYARRDPLEHIGVCSVRLIALAQHEDIPDFAATVEELTYSLDELWEGSLPTLRNLF